MRAPEAEAGPEERAVFLMPSEGLALALNVTLPPQEGQNPPARQDACPTGALQRT